MLRFPDYLESWGAAQKAADPKWTWVQAAAALGVSDEAIRFWRDGVTLPFPRRAERLVEMVGDPALRDLIEADRATMAAQRREARQAMPRRSAYPTPRTLIMRPADRGGAT